eukprot:3640494-Rhodomonas_salina.2
MRESEKGRFCFCLVFADEVNGVRVASKQYCSLFRCVPARHDVHGDPLDEKHDKQSSPVPICVCQCFQGGEDVSGREGGSHRTKIAAMG